MLIAMENKYFSELHSHPSNSFGCQHFRSGRTIGTARTARTTRTDVSASNLVTSSSAAQPPTWPTRATKPTAVCQIERKSLGIQLRWHQFRLVTVWSLPCVTGLGFGSVRFGSVWLGLVGSCGRTTAEKLKRKVFSTERSKNKEFLLHAEKRIVRNKRDKRFQCWKIRFNADLLWNIIIMLLLTFSQLSWLELSNSLS